MYNNWLKVCKLNRSLKERIEELTKENDVLKIATINHEFRASKREKKFSKSVMS